MCHVTKYLHTYVIFKLKFSIPTCPNYKLAILCCKILTCKLPCHDNGSIQISIPSLIHLSLVLTSDTMWVLHFVESMQSDAMATVRCEQVVVKRDHVILKNRRGPSLTLSSDIRSIQGYLTR